MKKIIFVSFILVFFLSHPWAKKRAPSASEIPDSYEEKVSEIKVDKKKSLKKANTESDPYNATKMRNKENRTAAQRIFNLNKFQRLEDFSVYTRPGFKKLFLRKAHLIHRTGTDIGGFCAYYDTSSYAIQFATLARAQLRMAVENYLRDFEEKKLERDAKKTEKIYGFCEAYEDFGVIEAMMMGYGKPRVYFGYKFMNENPYFLIFVTKTNNLETSGVSEYDRLKGEIIPQQYYFTRAQAKRLSAFLSDENISALQNQSKENELMGKKDFYSQNENSESEAQTTNDSNLNDVNTDLKNDVP